MKSDPGVFSSALKESKDISESYARDFGRGYFDRARDADVSVIELMRAIMAKAGLGLIADVIAPFADQAREVLDLGQVAAVDGTNAITPTTIMNATMFASAVTWVTSRARSPARTRITACIAPVADISSAHDLRELAAKLDAARDDESWPTTFREHEERTAALASGVPIVLIDGPIFTQNLLTQSEGRDLLQKMVLQTDQRFIGVIKDLRGSWAESKWAGYSLRTGEVYKVCDLAKEYKDRFKSHQDRREWAAEHTDTFSRYVYRPGSKAFGFECRQDDFPLALAILMANASPTIGHETPLLLEHVDARLRGEFNGYQARDILLGHLWGAERLMAFDLTDERGLR